MEEQKNTTQFKGVLILLLTSIIWGASFVSQSVGAESVEPFTFMGIRTLMGAVVLMPFIFIRDGIARRKMSPGQIAALEKLDRRTAGYGILIGIMLAIATNLQQYAFNYSTAGKIAFITAMYMFFVPIIGLFFRKRIPLLTWLCIFIGFGGLFCLCFKGGDDFTMNMGDLLALACALFFSFQILLIEKFAKTCDGIKLSCVEFFSCGVISIFLMCIFDTPSWEGIKQAGGALLYSGIMSCGIAYTLQVVGQKYCEATIASLLMCMESVFAALSAAILLNERLTPREIAGCAIMFAAIIISQLSGLKKKA